MQKLNMNIGILFKTIQIWINKYTVLHLNPTYDEYSDLPIRWSFKKLKLCIADGEIAEPGRK